MNRPQYWFSGANQWVSSDIIQGYKELASVIDGNPLVKDNTAGGALNFYMDNGSDFWQKSNGTVVVSTVPSVFLSTALAVNFAPAFTGPFNSNNPSSSPQLNGFVQIWTPPAGETFTYGGQFHPEQTWTGKTTDDVCMSYEGSSHSTNTDGSIYWGRFLQVSGL